MTDIFDMELEEEEEGVEIDKRIDQSTINNKSNPIKINLNSLSSNSDNKKDEDERENKKSPRIFDKSSPGGSTKLNKEMEKREMNEILGFSYESNFEPLSNKENTRNKERERIERDNNYMRSKMMYFNRINVGRSEIREVTKQRTSPENITCKSAPQSTPIPILYDNSSHSVFDPQIVVNTLSTTFIPPHEMINRSEFSVWEKDRKKVPKKYHFN
eukprot:TRINITY_DN189_c0_g1_i1.p1 TRINITY_DN189_c0_g1~~TRINITY_DN189_c0_g1_i1.p1  ORF type:complete len:215 (-),score=56.94 TRINITY_DN189_c0_g1_i1:169-813(-)